MHGRVFKMKHYIKRLAKIYFFDLLASEWILEFFQDGPTPPSGSQIGTMALRQWVTRWHREKARCFEIFFVDINTIYCS